MVSQLSFGLASMRLRNVNQDRGGPSLAKRKNQSKVQKRKGAKSLPKAKKLSKTARGKKAVKRVAAKAKPERAAAEGCAARRHSSRNRHRD
jgi:hypothetical protein